MSKGMKDSSTIFNKPIISHTREKAHLEALPVVKQLAPSSTGQRIQEKVVILTGTNSPLGIGRASAHQFAQNGAKAIFLCDIDNSYLEAHKNEINSLYPLVRVHIRQFDASDEDAVKSVVDDAIKLHGRLDIFFANAGCVGQVKHFTEITSDEFLNTLKINLLSVHLAAKFGAPAMMIKSGDKMFSSGSIICTASVAGLRSNAGSSDYSASKSGVISLVQTIAFQLAGTSIRINAICPGIIETGMTAPIYQAARAKGTERKIGQLNPLGRGAHADEVARVALFLGSDESSYVNGQAWAVDGGLSAGHPFIQVFYAVALAVSFDHGNLNSTYYNSGQLTGTSTFHQSTQLPTSIASSDCSKFMHTTVTVPVCTEYLTETETIQFNTSTAPSQSVSPNNPYQYEIPPYGVVYSTNDQSASSSAACSSIGIVASTTTILVEPTTITMTEIITSEILSTKSTSSTTATSSSTTIAEPTCTADILNDSQNCGKCGNICDTGICESGSCTTFQCSVESCGNFNQCGDQKSDCFCFSSTTPPPVKDNSSMNKMNKKSNGFCGKNAICSGLTSCASDLDCVAGSSGNICAISTCCPELSADKPGVCLEAQCGNPSQRLRVLSRIRSVKGITAAF